MSRYIPTNVPSHIHYNFPCGGTTCQVGGMRTKLRALRTKTLRMNESPLGRIFVLVYFFSISYYIISNCFVCLFVCFFFALSVYGSTTSVLEYGCLYTYFFPRNVYDGDSVISFRIRPSAYLSSIINSAFILNNSIPKSNEAGGKNAITSSEPFPFLQGKCYSTLRVCFTEFF